jgi:hypothetical protein
MLVVHRQHHLLQGLAGPSKPVIFSQVDALQQPESIAIPLLSIAVARMGFDTVLMESVMLTDP